MSTRIHAYDLDDFTAEYDAATDTINGATVLTMTAPCKAVEPATGVFDSTGQVQNVSGLFSAGWYKLQTDTWYGFGDFYYTATPHHYQHDYILAFQYNLPDDPANEFDRLDLMLRANTWGASLTEYVWFRAYWYGSENVSNSAQLRTSADGNLTNDIVWWDVSAYQPTTDYILESLVTKVPKIDGNYRTMIRVQDSQKATMGYMVDYDTYADCTKVTMRVIGANDELGIRGLPAEGHEEKFATLYLRRQAIWTANTAWTVPLNATSVDRLIIEADDQACTWTQAGSVADVPEVSVNGGVYTSVENGDLSGLGIEAGDTVGVRVYADNGGPSLGDMGVNLKRNPVIYGVKIQYTATDNPAAVSAPDITVTDNDLEVEVPSSTINVGVE